MADKDRGEKNAEAAFEQGYMGTIHDPIENDAYTLQGQGPETARREREAREQLRGDRIKASRDEGDGETASEAPAQAQATTTSRRRAQAQPQPEAS